MVAKVTLKVLKDCCCRVRLNVCVRACLLRWDGGAVEIFYNVAVVWLLDWSLAPSK